MSKHPFYEIVNNMMLVGDGLKIKNQDYLRRSNQSLVLDLILERGPISRAEIAKHTSMSPTSASRIVASLSEANLIREVHTTDNSVGRKANYYILNEDEVISIGVEIDQHYIRIGVMNFAGKLTFLQDYEYDASDPQETAFFLANNIQNITEKSTIDKSKIAGIGVGLPGLIESDTGMIKLSAQLDWREVPFADMLAEQTGINVFLDNELNLKALGEYNFVSEEGGSIDHMAMIGFGSGVGSALIFKGDIYRGEGNFSGEIGHTIVDPFGTYCPCGNYGCLQTYIAEEALLSEASKIKPIANMDELLDYYHKNAQWAVNIIDKLITYAAITVNNAVCIYNPDTVVLSGNLIEHYPEIREKIVDKCHDQIWSPVADTFKLRITNIGVNGVVMGGALKVRRHFITQIHYE